MVISSSVLVEQAVGVAGMLILGSTDKRGAGGEDASTLRSPCSDRVGCMAMLGELGGSMTLGVRPPVGLHTGVVTKPVGVALDRVVI
jgi:hypothetical protein